MAWIIQNDELVNTDSLGVPDKPFHGDSPNTFWRIDPNANEGMPYVGLMIGVPALATEQIDYLPITYKKEKLRFFMMLIGGPPPEDTNYEYIVDENDNAILVMYKGTNTVVTTPRMIDDHPVVGIMSTCYSYNTSITSITIRDGVEVID